MQTVTSQGLLLGEFPVLAVRPPPAKLDLWCVRSLDMSQPLKILQLVCTTEHELLTYVLTGISRHTSLLSVFPCLLLVSRRKIRSPRRLLCFVGTKNVFIH